MLVAPGDLGAALGDFAEEDVAVALEDDDEIFGMETLSITPDGVKKYTKGWGEVEEEEETAGPENKGGAAK